LVTRRVLTRRFLLVGYLGPNRSKQYDPSRSVRGSFARALGHIRRRNPRTAGRRDHHVGQERAGDDQRQFRKNRQRVQVPASEIL